MTKLRKERQMSFPHTLMPAQLITHLESAHPKQSAAHLDD